MLDSHEEKSRLNDENTVRKANILNLSFDISDDEVVNPLKLDEKEASKPTNLNGMLFFVENLCAT